MQERDYAAELYDKMAEEQSRFKDWLLTQPPEEILNHAYRYAVQEDILCAVEEMELDPKQARTMLKSPCPLEDVFKDYQKLETGYMDTIRETIEDRAGKLIRREKDWEAR